MDWYVIFVDLFDSLFIKLNSIMNIFYLNYERESWNVKILSLW